MALPTKFRSSVNNIHLRIHQINNCSKEHSKAFSCRLQLQLHRHEISSLEILKTMLQICCHQTRTASMADLDSKMSQSFVKHDSSCSFSDCPPCQEVGPVSHSLQGGFLLQVLMKRSLCDKAQTLVCSLAIQ